MKGTGLVEIAGGKPQKEQGFFCIELINFLREDGIKDWCEFHGAHIDAAAGQCHYTSRCHTYARTVEKLKKIGLQTSLLSNPEF